MHAWVAPRVERRSVGRKHPIDDFMFDYYPFSPGKLLTWHPGYGVELEGDVRQFLDRPAYESTRTGGATATLSWLNDSRRARLDLAIRILKGTSSRPANTGCFGMHEWAMVYGLEQSEIRHEQVPLRLTPDEIRDAVDGIGLRCTHIDAYRFFTDEAAPLNAMSPTRALQPDLDQSGCLHTNMDLYKMSMWFQPLVGSDLVTDSFALAREARTLDMQASPYDVSEFGLEPIPVETAEGRAEYARHQRTLMNTAQPLRARLLTTLELVWEFATDTRQAKSLRSAPAFGTMSP